jgi:hypothetical protein
MDQQLNYSLHCRYCGIVLVGKKQFIVHMIYNHDMDYEELIKLWLRLERESSELLFNGNEYTYDMAL